MLLRPDLPNGVSFSNESREMNTFLSNGNVPTRERSLTRRKLRIKCGPWVETHG